MATYIWCEIVCCNCSDAVSGRHTSGALPRREMKKEARKAGWVFSGNDAFCDTGCTEIYDRRYK